MRWAMKISGPMNMSVGTADFILCNAAFNRQTAAITNHHPIQFSDMVEKARGGLLWMRGGRGSRQNPGKVLDVYFTPQSKLKRMTDIWIQKRSYRTQDAQGDMPLQASNIGRYVWSMDDPQSVLKPAAAEIFLISPGASCRYKASGRVVSTSSPFQR